MVKISCFRLQLTELMMKVKRASQNPEFCITLVIFITVVLFVFVAIAFSLLKLKSEKIQR